MPLPARQTIPFIVTTLVVIALLTGMLWVDDHQVRASRSNLLPISPTAAHKATADTQAAANPKDDTELPGQTPTRLAEPVFAASLAGTEIDGQLRINAEGNLQIDLSVRDFFDYFLNTVGEVSAERMLAEVHQLIDQSLPATAAAQARALLASYIDYRHQLAELQNLALDPRRRNDPDYQLAMLAQGLDEVKALRQRSFPANVHQAFFALEEAYADYTLATLQVQQRDDLSDSEKHQLIRWQREQLPPMLRESEQRQQAQIVELRERQQLIETAPSPQAAAAELRAQGMTDAQAEEVADWLAEREAFDARFARYQQALANLNQAGLSDGDRVRQQQQLLDNHFADEQQQSWARLRQLESENL